jgi:hypothetical protein
MACTDSSTDEDLSKRRAQSISHRHVGHAASRPSFQVCLLRGLKVAIRARRPKGSVGSADTAVSEDHLDFRSSWPDGSRHDYWEVGRLDRSRPCAWGEGSEGVVDGAKMRE